MKHGIWSLILVIASCSTPDREELHPIVDRIPGLSESTIVIDKPASAPFPMLPEFGERTKLDIVLSERLEIITWSDSRLIILDRDANNLMEFDRRSGRSKVIASEGRGPGDLWFPSSLIRRGNALYVALGDMRMATFDCFVSPCEFVSEVKLPIAPKSAVMADSRFALLGTRPVTSSDPSLIEEVTTSKAISVVDIEGNPVASFGETYDYEGIWMLLTYFADGHIRQHSPSGQLVLAFETFPTLQLFDRSFKAVRNVRFSEFLQGTYNYDHATGTIGFRGGGFSQISNIHPVGNDLLIEITTRKNRRRVDDVTKWDVTIDYYRMSGSNGDITYAGTHPNPDIKTYFVDHGTVLQVEGDLHWIF